MKKKIPESPSPPAGQDEADQRVAKSKKAVLAATFELLSEVGLGGVSVDEVSRRSGVAKTTIYRHWPSRTALLMNVCATLGAKPQAPDTGSFERDLTTLVTQMAKRLRSERWTSILPSVIDAAEREPEVADMHAKIHATHIAPLYTIIERAKKRGELPRASDPSEIVASVAGPLFYRRWFSRQPLDDRFVQNLVGRIAGKSGG